MEERKNNVKQVVETAYGVLANYHSLALKGKMSQEEAKQSAPTELAALRYGGNEYFWVNDMQNSDIRRPERPRGQTRLFEGWRT